MLPLRSDHKELDCIDILSLVSQMLQYHSVYLNGHKFAQSYYIKSHIKLLRLLLTAAEAKVKVEEMSILSFSGVNATVCATV